MLKEDHSQQDTPFRLSEEHGLHSIQILLHSILGKYKSFHFIFQNTWTEHYTMQLALVTRLIYFYATAWKGWFHHSLLVGEIHILETCLYRTIITPIYLCFWTMFYRRYDRLMKTKTSSPPPWYIFLICIIKMGHDDPQAAIVRILTN